MLRETELSLCLVETKAPVISISLQVPARSCYTAWIDYIAKHSGITFFSMLCDPFPRGATRWWSLYLIPLFLQPRKLTGVENLREQLFLTQS
jgi:hypothetical protein